MSRPGMSEGCVWASLSPLTRAWAPGFRMVIALRFLPYIRFTPLLSQPQRQPEMIIHTSFPSQGYMAAASLC